MMMMTKTLALSFVMLQSIVFELVTQLVPVPFQKIAASAAVADVPQTQEGIICTDRGSRFRMEWLKEKIIPCIKHQTRQCFF